MYRYAQFDPDDNNKVVGDSWMGFISHPLLVRISLDSTSPNYTYWSAAANAFYDTWQNAEAGLELGKVLTVTPIENTP